MKYKLNDKVYVGGCEYPKTIVESESIDGESIYYMSDNTSYHEGQIKLTLEQYIELKTKFFANKNMIKDHIVNALQTYWDNRNKPFLKID